MVKKKKAKKKVVKIPDTKEKKEFNTAKYPNSIQTENKVDPKTKLGHFVCLQIALKGLFDKKLEELPKVKQKLINDSFPHHGLWNDMTSEVRENTAIQSDRQNDLRLEPLSEKLGKTCSERDEYEHSETTTALNITEKNKQLTRLRKEADRLDILLFGPLNKALAAAIAIKEDRLDEFLAVEDASKNGAKSRNDEDALKTKKDYFDKRNDNLQKDSEKLELEYIQRDEEYTLDDLASDLSEMGKYKKISLSKKRIRRLITRKNTKKG